MIGKKEQFNQNIVVSLIVVFLVVLSFQIASAETSMEQHRRGRRTYAKIPKLTGPQVAFLLKQNKILIVDAKNPNRFKDSHYMNAIHIPETKVHKVRLNVPKNQLIGVY